MPWNVSGVLDKREEFLAEYVSGDWTMSELCGMYRVMQHGQFFWNYNAVFLGKVLAGQSIGLLPIDDRCLRLDLGWYPVARFDSHTLRVEKLRPEDYSNDT